MREKKKKKNPESFGANPMAKFLLKVYYNKDAE